MDKRKKGFTLIELLVVIAIIALLLAILIPSLKKAKEQTRTIICRSNLKQWGSMFSLYFTDYESRFFSPMQLVGGVWEPVLWVEPLRPYYKDGGEDMRICPTATKDEFTPPGFNQTWNVTTAVTPGEVFRCSYGINNWFYDQPYNNPISNPNQLWNNDISLHWRRADVFGSGRIPLFLDSYRWGGHPLDIDIPFPGDTIANLPQTKGEFDAGVTTHDEMRRFCLDRHNGAINVLFLDMSADKVGLKELWELKWHREFKTAGYTALNPSAEWPGWMRDM